MIDWFISVGGWKNEILVWGFKSLVIFALISFGMVPDHQLRVGGVRTCSSDMVAIKACESLAGSPPWQLMISLYVSFSGLQSSGHSTGSPMGFTLVTLMSKACAIALSAAYKTSNATVLNRTQTIGVESYVVEYRPSHILAQLLGLFVLFIYLNLIRP